MAQFDVQGALKSGHSATDIVDYLSSQPNSGFDFSGARKAGFSDSEILDEFDKSQPTKTSMTTAIGAGLGRGFAEGVLGTEQLAGEGLSAIGSMYGPLGGIDKWAGSKLQSDAASGLAKTKAEVAPYSAAHPIATGAGEAIGSMVPAVVAPESVAGDLAPAATWATRAGQAARSGAVMGLEQPVDPNKQGMDYWEDKGAEVLSDTAANVAFGQVGEGVNLGSTGIGKYIVRNHPDAIKSQAVLKILKRIAQDERGGGPKAEDVIDAIRTGQAAGVPTTMMEVGGPNVKGEAGRVYRGKGEAKTVIDTSFKTRINDARKRLLAQVKTAFDAPQTMRQVKRALTASQRAAAKPLYDEALKPGSLAPLETQFSKAFNESSKAVKEAKQKLQDARNELTQAMSKWPITRGNVYSGSAAHAAHTNATANVKDAEQAVIDAEQEHQRNLNLLRTAQTAQANGERGGVWSPHIQRLMENPEMQAGIKTGLRIMRNEADYLNIPFNPRDFAITGYDKSGEPIVSKVPNMRLLDAAKKGLDHMLEEYRDKTTGILDLNGLGGSIDGLRRALLSEVDRINPAYKTARDAWAGPAANKGALTMGSKIMNAHPEDVEAIFSRMSPSEQEHYKIGAAQAYLDAIGRRSVISSAVRELSDDDTASMARERLSHLFKSNDKLDKFLQAVMGERAIYNARTEITGGSQTRARALEDQTPDLDTALHIAHSVVQAAGSHGLAAAGSLWRAIKHRTHMEDPRVDAEIARLLSDPKIHETLKPGEVLPQPAVKIRGDILGDSKYGSVLRAATSTGAEATNQAISGQ